MKDIVFALTCIAVMSVPLYAQDIPKQPGKMYVSNDKGESWNPAVTNLPEDVVINEIVEKDQWVFIATENHGIYASDNGIRWWPSGNGLFAKKIDALLVADNKIYAGTYTGGVFVSEDNGSSWHAMNKGLSDLTIRTFFTLNGKVLTGTNDGIYTQVEGGWEKLYGGLQINDFSLAGGTLFVAANRGVLLSPYPFRDWKLTLEGTAISMLATTSTGNTVMGRSYFSENFNINARGEAWKNTFPGVTDSPIYPALAIEDLLIGQSSGVIYESVDGGQTWNMLSDVFKAGLSIKSIKNTRFGLVVITGGGGC
jgi:photosystem II stability/assembly factor-like uncharacterized protein